MTTSKSQQFSGGEMEFIEAEVAVCGIRIVVAGALWCVAVSLIDRVAFHSSDPFVANLRLGLWLFLVEFLIATYLVRYTAPASYPAVKRVAFIGSEMLQQAAHIAGYVVLNLAIRWLVITVLTGITVWAFGAGWLSGSAAVAPTLLFLSSWLTGISAIGLPVVGRGSHLGSYMEAIAKCIAIDLVLRRRIAEQMDAAGIEDVDLKQIHVSTLPFGGVDLPLPVTDPHTLVLGTVSSGKTLMLRMLLRSYLTGFGIRRNRAMINDAKREYYSLLVGMGIPEADIILTSTADARGFRWDIAADVHDRNDATNIARILIPEDQRGNDNPFFTKAARALVTEALMCLHERSPGDWDLLELIECFGSFDRMKLLLYNTTKGREAFQRYFGREAEEMVGGIIATLDARFIAEYQTIADIWSRSGESFSLTEWVSSQKIILLGYDENSAGQDRINQAIFERAARLICALPDDPDGKAPLTALVLDEPAFLPKLPMLAELFSLGRTKGLRGIIAPQDLDGLYAKYGEHEINAILAVCGNVAGLRLLSPKTREWAAKFFGDHEAWETDYADPEAFTLPATDTPHYRRSGKSRRLVKRETILPSEFLDLPQTSKENGLHGFFASPAIGAWRAAIPSDWLDAHLSSRAEVPSFIRRHRTNHNNAPRESRESSRGKSAADTRSAAKKSGRNGNLPEW